MNQPYDPRHQGDAGDQQQGGYQAGPGGQYGQGGYGQGQPGGQYGGQYGEGQQYGGQYGEGQQYGGQYGEGQQYGQGGYGQGQSGDQYGQGGYGQGQYGQGAYGQGEYGQGGYGQGGYGQGEYGQGGYGQGQYGGGYVPPSGSGSKRPPAWIWAVVAVVVLAAAGVGAYFVFKGDNSKPSASSSSSAPGTSGPSASSSGGGSSSSSAPGGDTSGRSITLPSSFDSYQQIKSFDTSSLKTQLGAELAQFGTSSTSVVQHAQIGVYSKGSAATPSVVFIALALDDVPKLKDMVNAQGVESAVNEFVSGANGKLSGGGSPVIVSPGSLGGSMQCSVGNTSGQNIGFCGWGDKSIFAITIVTDAADPQAAAGVTRDLREAAEH